MSPSKKDILVIGAGMAGASVAAQCADTASVVLLEREVQPGYHSTGRSAAAFIPSYGCENPVLKGLTHCSYDFLHEPPAEFSPASFLQRRGLLTLQNAGDQAVAEAECAALKSLGISAQLTAPSMVRAKVPLVRDSYDKAGWYEPDVYDIDVHALHQAYLKQVRQRGGQLVGGVDIRHIAFRDGCWELSTSRGEFIAARIVNAAGAWADELAQLAGVEPLGLRALRRTAILLEPPEACDVSSWPLILSHTESFYIKPEAGLILVSPADESPSPPCDAQPEQIDIARAVAFAQQALKMDVRRVSHSWAGLRCFVADRTPVIGYAAEPAGFFWLVGQGGHGIQTAPAAARLAAALLLDEQTPLDLRQAGISADLVAPGRLAVAGSASAQLRKGQRISHRDRL